MGGYGKGRQRSGPSAAEPLKGSMPSYHLASDP